MDLSPKAVRFLIDALKHYDEYFDRRLEDDGLSDDDLSDLANDQQYLLALRQDLQSHHDDLLKRNVSVAS